MLTQVSTIVRPIHRFPEPPDGSFSNLLANDVLRYRNRTRAKVRIGFSAHCLVRIEAAQMSSIFVVDKIIHGRN